METTRTTNSLATPQDAMIAPLSGRPAPAWKDCVPLPGPGNRGSADLIDRTVAGDHPSCAGLALAPRNIILQARSTPPIARTAKQRHDHTDHTVSPSDGARGKCQSSIGDD